MMLQIQLYVIPRLNVHFIYVKIFIKNIKYISKYSLELEDGLIYFSLFLYGNNCLKYPNCFGTRTSFCNRLTSHFEVQCIEFIIFKVN